MATSVRIEARVAPELKALIQHAADLEGRNLTDFIVSHLRKAATEAVKEHRIIELSQRDSIAVAESLLAPPREPTPAAVETDRRYRLLVEERLGESEK
jgi:uncharacterized protein (DUF1778 family)